MKVKPRRKPAKSLRTILIIWFLLFSIAPLVFVTGYSLSKFEQAIDSETVQRLRANVREFTTILTDYQTYLDERSQSFRINQSLAYYLSTNSVSQARTLVAPSLRNSNVKYLSLFNHEGKLLARLSSDDAGSSNKDLPSADVYLQDSYKASLEKSPTLHYVESGSKGSMDLAVLTRIEKSDRLAGYVEEVINIGMPAMERLKKRLNLEIIFFDSQGDFLVGSHPDFALYGKKGFAKTIAGGKETLFDLVVREEPFRFIVQEAKWGETPLLVGLGASKQQAQATLKNVIYAFLTVIAAVLLLLLIASFFIARVVLRPLNELVGAIQTMDQTEGAREINVKSENEIGLLADSFNEMSQRVKQASLELQNKIKEIENAYSELKDTQAKLVQSAKMAGVGQLVAGVAHELNNPIGFIYSNMSHLREYSNALIKVIEVAENDPDQLAAIKKELDYDYILKDLPRLIQSCEEGARRTRDIVLGLRNFSRLEEAKIKSVSLQEGLENTLRLLAGELKTRIKVHSDFQNLPEVLCYASQINQVFMNILSNAAQAIEGEGEIWISTKDLWSEKDLSGQMRGRVQVSIRDSGKGMPADILERIFDPFFTTKAIGQGTGLGLSISYGIVRNHGGEIQVQSEPGKGTEFIVTLPIEGPASTEGRSAEATIY
jgi:two-component system NtrC family sensor kinase